MNDLTKAWLTSLLLAAAFGALPVRHAWAEGNPANGFEVFDAECGDCHTVRPHKNRKGPTLFGVIGRKAGTEPGYEKYSEAMKQSGIVWTAENIDRYVTHPKQVVPQGRMHYDGLASARAREDLIAYLADQH